MIDTKEMCRKVSYNDSGKDKRKSHKFSFTDDEFVNIERFTRENGYQRPRDWIVDIVRHESPTEALLKNQRQQFVIRLNMLATSVNKIRAGIDLENAYHDLVKGVDDLCRTYRL